MSRKLIPRESSASTKKQKVISARICMENLLVYKYGLCSQTISYQKTQAGTFEMPGKLSVTGLLLVAGGAGISLNSLIYR